MPTGHEHYLQIRRDAWGAWVAYDGQMGTPEDIFNHGYDAGWREAVESFRASTRPTEEVSEER